MRNPAGLRMSLTLCAAPVNKKERFPEKPSETVRKELKSNGFRWASIAACWQSYLNERQKYRIERILKNETAKS